MRQPKLSHEPKIRDKTLGKRKAIIVKLTIKLHAGSRVDKVNTHITAKIGKMFNASETAQMKPSQYLLRRSKSKMKKWGFLVCKICLATLQVLDVLRSKPVLGYWNRKEKGQKKSTSSLGIQLCVCLSDCKQSLLP